MSFCENLINEVKEHRILYDKTKTGYRNILVKSKAWQNIAAKLGETDEKCIKQWKSLRERFSREIKKPDRLADKSSTVGKEKKWELYDKLLFLRDVIEPRGRRDIYFEHEIEDMDSTECSEILHVAEDPFVTVNNTDNITITDLGSLSPTPKRTKLEETDTSLIPILIEAIKSSNNNRQPLGDTEEMLFAKNISAIVSNFSERKKQFVKTKILLYLMTVQNTDEDYRQCCV